MKKTMAICSGAWVTLLLFVIDSRRQPCSPRALDAAYLQQNSAFDIEEYEFLSNDDGCMPRRKHLAQRNNTSADGHVNMTLTFLLDWKHCRDMTATVYYGRDEKIEGHIDDIDDWIHFNYTSSESRGLFQSDMIFHVALPKLVAGLETYWYRIVVHSPQQTLLRTTVTRETRKYSFMTPPLVGQPTALALVGDLGQTVRSTRTMQHIQQSAQRSSDNPVPVTQVLIAGDLSYADADPLRWQSFMDVMEPLLQGLPLHAAAGNHEIECNRGTLDIFVPYEHYFRNPNRIAAAGMRPASNYKHWYCAAPSEFEGHYIYGNSFYAYEHGLAKVIVLNSYTNTRVGSVQYQWLLHELESVDRSKTPWVLVAFHSPLYTTFRGHVNESEANRMRDAMEPLFVQYGVNMCFSGHDHGYMRTYPLDTGGAIDPDGVVYITVGAGGNREGHAPGYQNTDGPELWVVARDLSDWGYGHLYIPNATHARFTWVKDGFDPDRAGDDDAWLVNPHAPAFFDLKPIS